MRDFRGQLRKEIDKLKEEQQKRQQQQQQQIDDDEVAAIEMHDRGTSNKKK